MSGTLKIQRFPARSSVPAAFFPPPLVLFLLKNVLCSTRHYFQLSYTGGKYGPVYACPGCGTPLPAIRIQTDIVDAEIP